MRPTRSGTVAFSIGAAGPSPFPSFPGYDAQYARNKSSFFHRTDQRLKIGVLTLLYFAFLKPILGAIRCEAR